MKKILLFIISAVMTVSLSAFEWGGKIANDTSFVGKSDSMKLKQSDAAVLWISTPLDKNNTTYFSAEGCYKFIYDGTDSAKKDVENILDLNLFKLSSSFRFDNGNVLSFAAGRYGISELSGLVFFQVTDGFNVKFSGQSFDLNAYAGYTGLLNSKDVSILTPEKTEYIEKDNDFYTLAPRYMPFGVTAAFPSVFANQRIDFQAWGFADFNGDSYNRYYAMLGFDGYLLKNLTYNLNTVVGTENFENLMNLSSVSFVMYPANFFGIKLSGNYASGKQGPFTHFKGFTSSAAYSVYFQDMQYSDLIKGGLGITKTFGQTVYLYAGSAAVFSVPADVIKYSGIQIQADVLWNIFNDVQTVVSFSQFIGDNEDNNRTSLSLKAVVAF